MSAHARASGPAKQGKSKVRGGGGRKWKRGEGDPNRVREGGRARGRKSALFFPEFRTSLINILYNCDDIRLRVTLSTNMHLDMRSRADSSCDLNMLLLMKLAAIRSVIQPARAVASAAAAVVCSARKHIQS